MGDNSAPHDHIVQLGKRIREVVDNCLEIDVGLEKRQKTEEEILIEKKQDLHWIKESEEQQKKVKAPFLPDLSKK